MFVLFCSSICQAGIVNVYVNPADDVVSGRWWGYFGNGNWTDVNANPNSVTHSYYPGDGSSANTSLAFQVPNIDPETFVSASVNINILNVHTEGRDDIGTFSIGSQPVLFSEGTGWKSFDVTDTILSLLENDIAGDIFNCSFNYTGYSGFTFGSAEGGDPAYLSIVTTTPLTSAVPIPSTAILLGFGLAALPLLRKKQ
jgi:hypothetical protein